MKPLVQLKGASLRRGASGITLSLSPGESLAVMGPGGAGKSRLLRVLAGVEPPSAGQARLEGGAAVASGAFPRRASPQTLARSGAPAGRATRATEALHATRLWARRQSLVSDLSPTQQAACELLDPLSSGESLLVMDGQLDRLDPWSLSSVLDLLARRAAQGAAWAVATHRADVAARCDRLVVLEDGEPRFAGELADLLREAPAQHLEVVAEHQPGVMALVEPLEVSVREREDGLVVQASEGQALAARLLLEGYGNARFVVVRQPTLADALERLLR